MNLTMKTKLTASFGLLLLIFSLAGLFSVLNMKKQGAAIEELVTNDMPEVETVAATQLLLAQYRQAEKDILLQIGVPDKQQEYVKKQKKFTERIVANFATLDKKVSADPDLAVEVRKLPATALEGFDTYDKLIQSVLPKVLEAQDGRHMSALEANALLGKSKESFYTAQKSLDELDKRTRTMIQANTKNLAELARRTETILMASVVLALLSGVILGVTTLRSITGPLGRVMAFAKAVAGGDLSAHATGTFTAEMAQLNQTLEAMMDSLKTKIAEADQKTTEAAEQARLAGIATGEANEAKARAERAKAEGMIAAATQLEHVVEIISSASEELSAQIEQSSRGTEVQSSRVGETATAMEEMNATVLEVAKNASQASDSSTDARAKALEGASVVAQVVAGIGSVQAVSTLMREDMAALGKQAEGIGQIMNVISDIADQTNLLALNAAIEAARAGDAGHGFAVVADEVRKLAEKTMTATKEVGEAISGIQKGTKKNLDNVERAVASIAQATDLANTSGTVLQDIVRLVEVSTDQVRSIAAASEEQSAASEEINRSIEDINRISGETASAMTQSAQAVGDLATQAGSLRTLIEEMKNGG